MNTITLHEIPVNNIKQINKKVLKIKVLLRSTLIFICLLVFGMGFYFYSMFNGNPFSKHSFEKKVNRYLTEKYKDNYVIEEVTYSFKQSTKSHQAFYAEVRLKNNPNIKISINNNDGELQESIKEIK